MIGKLTGRSLLHLFDFSSEEISGLIDFAAELKQERIQGIRKQRFQGMTLAMIFEKRSTRTRCAFETAFGEEGGHPVFLSTADIQLGGKESVEDTARVLGRMFDGIQFRGFKQATVETLAEYSGVPVFNGLTDTYHPTQALADILTMQENFGNLKGRVLSYIGDGRNNVASSLLIICGKLGIKCRIICPAELSPPQELIDAVNEFSETPPVISSNLLDVRGSDVVYTDVWVSMGEEAQAEQRKKLLGDYQVNATLMSLAGENAVFLHCLPAVVGQEVSKDVFEGNSSRVWDQAENRKHTIKAVMLSTMVKE
ncbi:ornithine carbamoyltransferase [Spirochaeta dissipatitropha]